MASDEPPAGVFNGNGAPNPDILVTTPDALTDDVPFRVTESGDTPRSPTRDVPPVFAQGDSDVGNGGAEGITNINKLDFFTRDPRIAKAPYCMTQVEYVSLNIIIGYELIYN